MAEVKTREGRIFIQLEDLTLFDLAQCTGLSDWNMPRDGINPIRRPSRTKAQAEDLVGYTRATADMPAFTINARFMEVGNFLMALNCEAIAFREG
jgi:hypothetical protein